MEMNGKVTDQAPQLIHCPLGHTSKEGPCFSGIEIRAHQKYSKKIRNTIWCECKLVPFWRSNWKVYFTNTWCQHAQF